MPYFKLKETNVPNSLDAADWDATDFAGLVVVVGDVVDDGDGVIEDEEGNRTTCSTKIEHCFKLSPMVLLPRFAVDGGGDVDVVVD